MTALRNVVAHLEQPAEALFEAVNMLGSDTDTIATLTGTCFGWATVPPDAADAELMAAASKSCAIVPSQTVARRSGETG